MDCECDGVADEEHVGLRNGTMAIDIAMKRCIRTTDVAASLRRINGLHGTNVDLLRHGGECLWGRSD